jgi:hypothetical protein
VVADLTEAKRLARVGLALPIRAGNHGLAIRTSAKRSEGGLARTTRPRARHAWGAFFAAPFALDPDHKAAPVARVRVTAGRSRSGSSSTRFVQPRRGLQRRAERLGFDLQHVRPFERALGRSRLQLDRSTQGPRRGYPRRTGSPRASPPPARGSGSSPRCRTLAPPRGAIPRGGQHPPLLCRDRSGIGRASHPGTSTRGPRDWRMRGRYPEPWPRRTPGIPPCRFRR